MTDITYVNEPDPNLSGLLTISHSFEIPCGKRLMAQIWVKGECLYARLLNEADMVVMPEFYAERDRRAMDFQIERYGEVLLKERRKPGVVQ